MNIKDMFLLKQVRNDLGFFITRFIAGFILGGFAYYAKVINSSVVISEVQEKQLILLVPTLLVGLFMYGVYQYTIRKAFLVNSFYSKIQKKLIYFCETLTSMLRSGLVIGLSTLIICMIAEKNIIPIITCINFLITLEILTDLKWKDFEADEADYETVFEIHVVAKDSKEETE